MTTIDPVDSREMLEAGPRVGLRYLMESDRDAYTKLRRESRSHLEPWEPAPLPGVDPYSPTFFDRQLIGVRTMTSEKFAIVRLDDRSLVGHMTIGGIIRGAGQMGHLGYWIGKPFAAKGYMTEAIGLTLAHCFVRLGLHRIEANIQPHNEPSVRAVRACGFRYEGLAKGLVQIRGEWRDHLRFAITADEWTAQANAQR